MQWKRRTEDEFHQMEAVIVLMRSARNGSGDCRRMLDSLCEKTQNHDQSGSVNQKSGWVASECVDDERTGFFRCCSS
jgi:hypothetical protein